MKISMFADVLMCYGKVFQILELKSAKLYFLCCYHSINKKPLVIVDPVILSWKFFYKKLHRWCLTWMCLTWMCLCHPMISRNKFYLRAQEFYGFTKIIKWKFYYDVFFYQFHSGNTKTIGFSPAKAMKSEEVRSLHK